ncbi:hypothetical protein BY996DRAFT_6410315 [Phakopsora pachyrhizi]|nr:hypothetical protein BY996DRAFT_6410315 [Phakopsora pachyrhizi]
MTDLTPIQTSLFLTSHPLTNQLARVSLMTVSGFETSIFPVDVIEIKDLVAAFHRKQKGNKFILITTNDPNHNQGQSSGCNHQNKLQIYGIDPKKGDSCLLKSLK